MMGELRFGMSVCLTINNIAKMQRCLGYNAIIKRQHFR